MKKFFISAAIIALFSGCLMPQSNAVGANSSGNNSINWTKYLENNATVQEIAFYSENLTKTMQLKDGDIIGIALTKAWKDGKDYALKIGDMYANGGQAFIVIDFDGKAYVDMRERSEVKALLSSKNIKFYESGHGILESVTFNAGSKSVCEAFLGGDKISAKIVTNYYDAKLQNEFFAVLIDTNIVKDKVSTPKSIDFKFFVSEANLQKVSSQAKSAEFKKQVIDKDILKQQRILKNIICAVR
ncbi:MAG: hypothetical protein LUC34_00760 [Campylobacter sp.]|nr:hypothetical protein [Campylobacter sp.]